MLRLLITASLLLSLVPTSSWADSQGKLTPATITYAGPEPPWSARSRKVRPLHPPHQALIDLGQWPEEPTSPEKPRLRRFARAVGRLCGGRMRRGTQRYLARMLLRTSRRFGVDPFLLTAVIYQESGCSSKLRRMPYGVGIGAINFKMHRPFVRRRRYRYWVLDPKTQQWSERKLRMRHHGFSPANIKRLRPSIYFTAALLKVYTEQCPTIDGPFGSVPHRHPVSHIIWGDRVEDAGHEDLILWARRRMISHYKRDPLPLCGQYNGQKLHAPFDGAPLKVLSGWGEYRSGRKRRHKGIDIIAPPGTPVYAVAPGRVMFAGAAVRSRSRRRRRMRTRSANLPYRRARRIRHSRLGAGGLFVMLRHKDGLVSAYMHLKRFNVERGQRLKQGDKIGEAGASGIRRSAPHLHFELRRYPRDHLDPLPHFEACTLSPRLTYVGRQRAETHGLNPPANDMTPPNRMAGPRP